MKICLFSKYPPIEGGTSARTYWLAKALGQRKIEVHLITNALEVEDNYKEKINWESLEDISLYQPENVFVHSLSSPPPFHIPYSPAYLERLINQGVKIIQKYQCDLIDSYYMLPYGLAGFFAKFLTGRPQIFRPAGPDITQISKIQDLQFLFTLALKNIDIIATQKKMAPFFEKMGIEPNRLHFTKANWPHPEAFNPDVAPIDWQKLGIQVPKNTPVITYIGKSSKEFKGLYELARVLKDFKNNFFLVLITNGKNIEELENYLENLKGLRNKYKIAGFLPPWRIPAVIKASACVVELENGFPIKIHNPAKLKETMAVGRPCLISDELYEKFKEELNLKNGKNVLVANPKNPDELKKSLETIFSQLELLDKIGREAHNTKDWQKEFDEYIGDNIKLYENVSQKTGDTHLEKALKIYEKWFGK